MEQNEAPPCIFLGLKVKPGSIERIKLENFNLNNAVTTLRTEAEKKSGVPASSLGMNFNPVTSL